MFGCTVEELQARMDSREFSEWGIYAKNHWLPDEQMIYLLASLCTMTANVNRKKGSKVIRLTDFLPWNEDSTKKLTDPLSQMSYLKSFTKAAGGKVLGPNRNNRRSHHGQHRPT